MSLRKCALRWFLQPNRDAFSFLREVANAMIDKGILMIFGLGEFTWITTNFLIKHWKIRQA